MNTKLQNARVLNAREMKSIVGGREGVVVGYRYHEGTCYIDIEWNDGTTECDKKVPSSVCEEKLHF